MPGMLLVLDRLLARWNCVYKKLLYCKLSKILVTQYSKCKSKGSASID